MTKINTKLLHWRQYNWYCWKKSSVKFQHWFIYKERLSY